MTPPPPRESGASSERKLSRRLSSTFFIPDLSSVLLENAEHDIIAFFSLKTIRVTIGILLHVAAAVPTEAVGGRAGDAMRWLLPLKLVCFRRLHALEQPLVENNYIYAAYLILQLFGMLFLVGHWSACWWIELIHVDGTHESADMADGTELYVYSLYLSFLSFMGQDIFALTTKQRIFGLFTLIVGTTMYAVLLGKMAVVLTNVSLTTSRQRHKRNMLIETMASMGLPSNLVTKVRKYLQLCIDTKRDLEGINLLRELPDCIYSEIATHLYSATILKVPMFKNCKKGFINAVAQMLLPEVHPPGQRIVEAGTMGKEMYFIIQGMVSVETREGTIVALLNGGTFFGEMALLGNGLRTAHVTAVAKTELCLLNKSDLELVLQDFKEESQMFAKLARDRARDLNTAHIIQHKNEASERTKNHSSTVGGTGLDSTSSPSTPDVYSPVATVLDGLSESEKRDTSRAPLSRKHTVQPDEERRSSPIASSAHQTEGRARSNLGRDSVYAVQQPSESGDTAADEDETELPTTPQLNINTTPPN